MSTNASQFPGDRWPTSDIALLLQVEEKMEQGSPRAFRERGIYPLILTAMSS
jgi:hypothetical protein